MNLHAQMTLRFNLPNRELIQMNIALVSSQQLLLSVLDVGWSDFPSKTSLYGGNIKLAAIFKIARFANNPFGYI